MSEPFQITDSEFEGKVLKSALPVIVDFWAPWCGPCRVIAPALATIAREYESRLIVVKLNTDKHAQWAQHYGVQSIPTLLFIAGGKVKSRQVGVVSASMLKTRVEGFLSLIGQPQH
jgi:thioredoxin